MERSTGTSQLLESVRGRGYKTPNNKTPKNNTPNNKTAKAIRLMQKNALCYKIPNATKLPITKRPTLQNANYYKKQKFSKKKNPKKRPKSDKNIKNILKVR